MGLNKGEELGTIPTPKEIAQVCSDAFPGIDFSEIEIQWYRGIALQMACEAIEAMGEDPASYLPSIE